MKNTRTNGTSFMPTKKEKETHAFLTKETSLIKSIVVYIINVHEKSNETLIFRKKKLKPYIFLARPSPLILTCSILMKRVPYP